MINIKANTNNILYRFFILLIEMMTPCNKNYKNFINLLKEIDDIEMQR